MRRTFLGAVSLVVLVAALGPAAPSVARPKSPPYKRPRSLTYAAGKLLFVAHDRAHGVELWKTTGTDASTRIVEDVETGLENYGEALPETIWHLTRWKGDLYYARNSDAHAAEDELWKTDGTKAGTHIVKDVPRAVWSHAT
jgi:ELWxxDGT repeat protein